MMTWTFCKLHATGSARPERSLRGSSERGYGARLRGAAALPAIASILKRPAARRRCIPYRRVPEARNPRRPGGLPQRDGSLKLALLAALFTLPAPALSQTVTLVDNTRNTVVSTAGGGQFMNLVNYNVAQKFVTGGAGIRGYVLESVDLTFLNLNNVDIPRVTLNTLGRGGEPGKVVRTLIPPSRLRNTSKWTVPAGTILEQNSTYFIVVHGSSNGTTVSGTVYQHQRGEAGWSIHNTGWKKGRHRSLSLGTHWRTYMPILLMRLRGTVRIGSSSDASLSGLRFHVAGTSTGISLNETFAAGTTAYTADVERHITRLTVTPSLGTTVGTLRYLDTNDMVLTDAQSSTPYTHEIALGDSNTVVKIEVTAENGVDKKVYTVTFSKSDTIAPKLKTATADWSELVLTYDEPLDDTSTPDPSAYSVSVDGGAAVAPSSVAVDGNAVTLTLATPVEIGQKVRVSYTKPTGMDDAPVQDAEGNDVDGLTNRSVTNLTTGPVFQSATVNGSVLVMTYHVALDGNSVPNLDAFSVEVSRQPRRILTVAVNGRTVTLTLASPVAAWQPVTVSYAQPRGTGATPIRTDSARPAASLTNRNVVNQAVDLRPPVTGPALVSNLGRRSTLDEKIPPFAQRFATGDNAGGYAISSVVLFLGRPHYPGVGARVQIYTNASNRPGRLLATLTSPSRRQYNAANTWTAPAGLVLAPETAYWVYVTPIKPRGTSSGSAIYFRKTSSKSNDPGSASGWRIADDSRAPPYGRHSHSFPIQFAIRGAPPTAPTITGVAVTSTPQAGQGTYGAGEVIEFTVTFSETVTATGEPHFVFSLGGTNVNAQYDDLRSDGSRLVFGYTVQSGDSDSDGIFLLDGSDFTNRDGAVVLDEGESIRSTSSSTYADLAHSGRGLRGGHKVDGSLSETTAPSTETVTVDGSTMVLTYDERLDESSVPMPSAFSVTAGGTAVTVSRVTVIDRKVTLTLALPAKGGETVTVSYTAPTGTGATPVRDLVENPAASLTGEEVTNNTPGTSGARRQVAVTGVPTVSGPAANGAYAANERIDARVTFDAPVVVDMGGGAPTLGLALGGVRREAAFKSGSGTAELVFSLRVPAANAGAAKAKAIANGLLLNGATIRSEDGTDAVLDYGSAPGTVSVTVAQAPGGDGLWSPDEAVTVAVTFAEPVAADTSGGTPSIGVLLGGSVAKQALYTGGTDTATLTFAYSLVAADTAVNSVLVPLNGLALNGGTIRSTAGLDAGLDHTGAGRVGVASRNVLPVLSVADAQASEDETLSFIVTLKPPASAPVTVAYATADGTATAGSDYTAASGTLSFKAGESEKTVTVTVAPDSDPEGSETLTLTLSSPSGATIGDDEATGTVTDPPPPPVTAEFRDVPAEHDGSSAFDLDLHFSVAPKGLSYRTLRGNSFFDISNGTVTGATRLANKDNSGWLVTVEPDSDADVTIGLLPALPTADCAEAAVVCTADGTRLSEGAEAVVPGPATFSVVDAQVQEGPSVTLDFVVMLSRARHEETRVDYATSNDTATAGADYTSDSGTLTFAVGETEQTVSVTVLDDDHDEGAETMTFTLTNPVPVATVKLADDMATGTITNSDPMPQAWIARFGRTVTGQVLDAVEARLSRPRRPGMEATLAGQALLSSDGEAGSGWPGGSASDDNADSTLRIGAGGRDTMAALPRWMFRSGAEGAGEAVGGGYDAISDGHGRSRLQSRALTAQDFVTGTSFALTGGSSESGGIASLWGQGSITRFDGREVDLSVDGEVATRLIGVDWTSGRWTMGLAIGDSGATGGYLGSGSGGTIDASLVGLYPYVGLAPSDRLSVWAAAGYGAGEFTLKPSAGTPVGTDLSMTMGAAGMRLMASSGDDGLSLAVKADTRFTRTATKFGRDASGGNLAAAEADVWLVRGGLEAARRFALGGEATLTPSLEVGVRLDGGDAETGFGADIGAGLALSNPGLGLSLDLKARGLVAHEASGFREWGASASLTYDPRPSAQRGLALTLRQNWGASPSGGMDALLQRETLTGLAANDNGGGRIAAAGRLDGEIGYRFPVFDGGSTGTPNVGFSLTEVARDYRAGWRLTPARRRHPGLEVTLDVTRRETANDDAVHGVMLEVFVRW